MEALYTTQQEAEWNLADAKRALDIAVENGCSDEQHNRLAAVVDAASRELMVAQNAVQMAEQVARL